MKRTVLLITLLSLLGCSRKSGSGFDQEKPSPAEQKIIDAAVMLFRSNGDYDQIRASYTVALRPVLVVRKTLEDGACTGNVFQSECCCPWSFSMDPYDVVNGGLSTFNYPKTVLFSPLPGKMEGTISFSAPARPVPADITDIHFDHLAFLGTPVNLHGKVSVNDIVVTPDSHNLYCKADCSGNSILLPSGKMVTVNGHLLFTDGDTGGELEVIYDDNTKISADITLSGFPVGSYAGFKSTATFTMDGVTAGIDFAKSSITIDGKTYKVKWY